MTCMKAEGKSVCTLTVASLLVLACALERKITTLCEPNQLLGFEDRIGVGLLWVVVMGCSVK